MNVVSPDINVLDFSVVYDLSVVIPKISIINQSTGSNLAGCTWWLILTTPSGTFIHNGNSTSPDKTGIWSSWILPDVWPQPFKQIEWSGNEYIATLYVKDSQNTIFSFSKTTSIIRPQGSIPASTDNFATGDLNALMQCEAAELYVEDTSAYSYNGLFSAGTSTTITLVYPADNTGTVPPPVSVFGNSAVKFPIPYSGDCFQLVLSSIARYNFSNGTSVILKYKARKDLSLYCDIDLCPLIEHYNNLLSKPCGESAAERQKRDRINALMLQAMIGKMQPLCNVNVSDIVEQVKKLGGWDCECRIGGGVNVGAIANHLTLDMQADCGDLRVTEATVTGGIVRIRLRDTTYNFTIAEDSDLKDALNVESSYDPNTCTRTFGLAVGATELASGIQELLLGYVVGVDSTSDLFDAFSFPNTLNLVTNTRQYNLKVVAQNMISADPLNTLEVKSGKLFLNPAKLLTLISTTAALKDYFCTICAGSPPACPVVTGLTATLGAYDPGTNTYSVTLNWTPAAGALNYSVTFGGTTITEPTSSHVFHVAPGATYSYGVVTNCTGSTSASSGGSISVPVAPSSCNPVTGVTVTLGAWNGSQYSVTVAWTPAASAVSFTITTPTGNVTTGASSYTFLQNAATTYNGTVTQNCSGSSATPVAFTSVTSAMPVLAPAPTVKDMHNTHFGSSSNPYVFVTVDPSVTGVVISQGTLSGSYTYSTASIPPGTNVHPDRIAPTPGGFGAHDITYAGSSNLQGKKIKLSLTNAAGTIDYEYYEFGNAAGFIGSPPIYVRATNPTIPYATASNIVSGGVRLDFHANGASGINFSTGDIWAIRDGVYNPDVAANFYVFTGLSSGVHVFDMEVSTGNGASFLAVVPIIVNIP